MGTRLAKLRRRSLTTRSALLVAVATALYALVAPVAYFVGGGSGLAAAGVAALLCLAGALIALGITRLRRAFALRQALTA